MVIKKNKKGGLVTPASGSPEVDQGLTKRSLINTLVRNAVKQPQAVKAVVKTIKINQLPTSQSLSVKQKEQ
jgi:hypothetical protein